MKKVWNMEWKILKGVEYGKFLFHSIACPVRDIATVSLVTANSERDPYFGHLCTLLKDILDRSYIISPLLTSPSVQARKER